MNRFINPQRDNYHHRVISEFTDVSSFLVSGIAKNHSTIEYSWVADLLYDQTGNSSINPHTAFIDFIGDRNLMYQEYGNVPDIYNNYLFFSEWGREILSNNSHELSTKQYSRVGQRYSEFDLIEYTNVSDFIFHNNEDQPEIMTAPNYVRHKFFRVPGNIAAGYIADLSAETIPQYLDYHIFIKEPLFNPTIDENNFSYYLTSVPGEDIPDSVVRSEYDDWAEVLRLVDYKVDVDAKVFYYPDGLREWVMYYNDTDHYASGDYYPYYGHVNFFKKETTGDYAGRYVYEPTNQYDGGGLFFFPEVVQRGVFEPAKIIASCGTYNGTPQTWAEGCMDFNPSNHLGDPSDQSEIVYNICKRLIRKVISFQYIVERRDDSGNLVYSGVDLDTERNRRMSSVVMTEPYFVVDSINGGEVVDYSFVNKDGTPVKFDTPQDFIDNPDIFLKVQATNGMLKQLDEILVSTDNNTDIINVLTIENPTDKLGDLLQEALYYDNFGLDEEAFFKRQDDCLDDLIEGRIGIGHHKTYYITAFGDDADKYSDGKMRVCGMGFQSKTNVDASGNITGTTNFLNVYCNNYIPVSCSIETTPIYDPIPNSEKELITNASSIVNKVSRYEKFRPMLKMSGMNGYVKIIERNKHFKITRAPDGRYEMIFNVEFPYCPGSYAERTEMDFSESTTPGFIYNKAAYINAGSWEAFGVEERYDSGNDRYVPFRYDSFTRHSVLTQITTSPDGVHPPVNSGSVYTDKSSKGGGYAFPTTTSENRIRYPASTVWEKDAFWKGLTIHKSQVEGFERYGTYVLKTGEHSTEDYFSRDMKLICLSDNRQWRFNEDKYSSYIGRENPSMVCKIDIATLQKDFTEYQKLHGSIPDSKRWLQAYFSGFAHVVQLDLEDERLTEKISTNKKNSDLTTKESKSDLIIEIWDSESDVGNGSKGNWRPFLYNGFDLTKIPGKLLVDNIYITDDPAPEELFIGDPAFIATAHVGYYSNSSFDFFPEYVKFTEEDDFGILNDQSNLILYDKTEGKSFHIAYVEPVSGFVNGDIELYKIYFRFNPATDGALKIVTPGSQPSDWTPEYQILSPKRMLSKDAGFSFDSIRAVNGVEGGALTRFIDLKSESPIPSDLTRYSIDDKIYFRVRIVKNSEYPVSYTDEDTGELIFVGDKNYIGGGFGQNNPWNDDPGVVYDKEFDWAKIQITEHVRKLGLGYFRCSSK